MNEFKRCMTVFTHSPFKVRLMLLNMLCDMFNNKPHQDDKPSHLAALRYAASFSRHNLALNWLPAALFPIFFTDLQSPSQNICLATVDII